MAAAPNTGMEKAEMKALLTKAKTNVSALELMRDLGVSYRSAWLVKHKLMETMRLREESRQLSGRVEIDDSYLGGERMGGKPGRGSENKVPFVAAVQTTEDGQTVRFAWPCVAPRRRAVMRARCLASKRFIPPFSSVSITSEGKSGSRR